ncbi:PRC-barrel domain-containing protein [Paenibacillus sp. KN14-4R]|uniref:PRC-barrel domain-containing protein n=1 Tax=Paenibacillus sp. KN14-4R TaxID=3445773 RepID=UPI003F9FC64C
MRKARNIVGLPIFCLQTGKKVGNVNDLLISQEWQVHGICLRQKNWFTTPQYMKWESLSSCGDDALTVEENNLLTEWDAESITLLDGKRKVKGLPVVTTNGIQLGYVEDVYLEEQLGNKIIGFELSEGFISDLIEGRKWLPYEEPVIQGEDALIVPVHCQDQLKDFIVDKEE